MPVPALLVSLALALPAAALAQPLPPAAPGSSGLSAEGLARIDAFWQREIAARRIPGAVVAIARDGKLVHHKAYGVLDPATNQPMPLDAIFQLASMTKVMTGVAALTLTEEGRLPLKSRLDGYFPQFANAKVGVVGPGGELTTVPAKEPISIQDLMRHTSGITYGGRGSTAVHKLWPASSSATSVQYTGAEFIDKIGPLPLLYQPGTTWDYGLSIDVLGLVVEKVSGQRLGDYMKAAFWDKLKMTDATFWPSAAQRQRVARPLPQDPLTGRDQAIASLDRSPKFDCGGGCAFATVGDYLRFAQMLNNGGVLDGQRILSPKTVQHMTSDHLGATIKNNVAALEGHREGYGFGLTVAVRLVDGLAATPGTPGDYTWNGANGTLFWNDPQEKLTVVVGTAGPGEIRKVYREQMGVLVYGAMVESRRGR
ncbi:MAG: serine hydrolase domain-containing protein [Rubrivivax sp.]